MKKFLKCIIILGFCNFLCAQDSKTNVYQDSLQTIIDSDFGVLKTKEALFLLGEHLVQRNPEHAEDIAKKLKENYIVKEDSVEIRRSNYIFAASHRWQGDYSTALRFYQNIYEYSKRQKDSLDIAKSGHFIGTLNTFLGNNIVAQKCLIEASDIYDIIGSAEQKADINSSLAGFYWNLDRLEESKSRYTKALKQFEILNDQEGMASVNANLGLLYTELGEFEKAEMHLMQQKELNKVFPTLREMGFHYDFLGLLRQEQGRLQEAYNEHLKALKIREKLSSTYNLCESKLNMGDVLIKLKKYPEAIIYLNDVFNYDEHESLYQQQSAYQLLSEAYEKSGSFKNSLSNFKKYKEISDSIYSKESIEIIAEKDALYKKQKQDAEIAILNKENLISEKEVSRSKVIALFSLVGLVLLLITAGVLYKLYLKINQKNQVISKALKDRELLLHETHHRVKNNLQMISSLLNLQSKYVQDDKVHEVLQNGRNRVQSMAILHKNLYMGKELDMVNIQTYFEGLIKNILNSYNKNSTDIKLEIKAKNIIMDVESVIPIGLIVNELVTNALKHAFSLVEIDNPTLGVTMEEKKDNYVLTVKDNGVGMEDNQHRKTQSFGQKLIGLFTNKLKATVTINKKNGVEVIIVFPKKKLT